MRRNVGLKCRSEPFTPKFRSPPLVSSARRQGHTGPITEGRVLIKSRLGTGTYSMSALAQLADSDRASREVRAGQVWTKERCSEKTLTRIVTPRGNAHRRH